MFDDDHGRAFGDALAKLKAEAKTGRIEHVLHRIMDEASRCGEPRDRDPEQALRLLALDGYLTEILGSGLVAGDRPDLSKYTQVLTGDILRAADN